ncbi:MAG TPA: M48 family metallopeptidase, partial [Acidimicrobiales bacterium]|nr:M48 family metallopeptidase [Acidimicrobiales bacterium]
LAASVQPYRAGRRRRRGGVVLEPAGAPQLFALVQEVAAAVQAPRVQSIRLTSEFNASYGRIQRRRRELTLGLCLWSILEPPERVALIGHELGHAVNRDVRNSAFVRRAVASLGRWRLVLNPRVARIEEELAPAAAGVTRGLYRALGVSMPQQAGRQVGPPEGARGGGCGTTRPR